MTSALVFKAVQPIWGERSIDTPTNFVRRSIDAATQAALADGLVQADEADELRLIGRLLDASTDKTLLRSLARAQPRRIRSDSPAEIVDENDHLVALLSGRPERFLLLPKDQQNDRAFLVRLLATNPECFAFLSAELRSDLSFVLQVLPAAFNPAFAAALPEAITDEPTAMDVLVAKNVLWFACATGDVAKNPALQHRLARAPGFALSKCSTDLRANEAFFRAELAATGKADVWRDTLLPTEQLLAVLHEQIAGRTLRCLYVELPLALQCRESLRWLIDASAAENFKGLGFEFMFSGLEVFQENPDLAVEVLGHLNRADHVNALLLDRRLLQLHPETFVLDEGYLRMHGFIVGTRNPRLRCDLMALRQQDPEAFAKLNHDLAEAKITRVDRFASLAQLQAVLADCLAPNDTRPVAVIIAGLDDHNGAFGSMGSEVFDELRAQYRLVYVEAAFDRQAVERLEALVKKQGKRFATGGIVAHGHVDKLDFTEIDEMFLFDGQRTLDFGDEELMRRLGACFEPDASFFLFSCSTGAGGALARNLANKLASTAKLRVSAPTVDTNVKRFRVVRGRPTVEFWEGDTYTATP